MAVVELIKHQGVATVIPGRRTVQGYTKRPSINFLLPSYHCGFGGAGAHCFAVLCRFCGVPRRANRSLRRVSRGMVNKPLLAVHRAFQGTVWIAPVASVGLHIAGLDHVGEVSSQNLVA